AVHGDPAGLDHRLPRRRRRHQTGRKHLHACDIRCRGRYAGSEAGVTVCQRWDSTPGPPRTRRASRHGQRPGITLVDWSVAELVRVLTLVGGTGFSPIPLLPEPMLTDQDSPLREYGVQRLRLIGRRCYAGKLLLLR